MGYGPYDPRDDSERRRMEEQQERERQERERQEREQQEREYYIAQDGRAFFDREKALDAQAAAREVTGDHPCQDR